jgi:hypothetical protein
MNRVELVYDRTCPHVAAARARIGEALMLAGLPPSWHEWDRDGADTPEALRPFGSPTVLVDGRDVSGPSASGDAQPMANSCRVYRDPEHGLTGVPAVQLIVTALQATPQ